MDHPDNGIVGASSAPNRTAVDRYLEETLGPEYRSGTATSNETRQSFLVRCTRPDLSRICVVGRVSVELGSCTVVPLSHDEIREIRERTEWESARLRGELARDSDGYLLRDQARRLASRWLDKQLGMKFGATGGIFIPLEPPVWQCSIYFGLRDLYLEPLGVVDVNALNGDVYSVTTEQLGKIEEKVRAIVQHQELATAV